MSILLAARLVEILLGISLIIQTAEYLKLLEYTKVGGVWDWNFQRADVPASQIWVLQVLDFFFTPENYKLILVFRFVFALSLIFSGVSIYTAWALLLSNLLILIRWRGAFNGGSDFMTLVVTCGLTLGQTWSYFDGQAMGWVAALWYISIHSISSYFMSGWVKLLNGAWRRGISMPVFLDTGVYGPLQDQSILANPVVARLCSWSFILWEASMPLALTSYPAAMFFCSVAVVFHFLVFWFFGLNRFFWAWISSLPAILYCSTWNWSVS